MTNGNQRWLLYPSLTMFMSLRRLSGPIMVLKVFVPTGKWLLLSCGFGASGANNRSFTCLPGLHWCPCSRGVWRHVCTLIWLLKHGMPEDSFCCLLTLQASASQNPPGVFFLILLANLISLHRPDQDFLFIILLLMKHAPQFTSLSLFLSARLRSTSGYPWDLVLR